MDRIEENKKLIEKYPFLQLPLLPGWEEDYSLTWLDYMPNGWRKAFGMDLVYGIASLIPPQEMMKEEDKYKIIEVKEKYGQLRWVATGKYTSILDILIKKYEQLSTKTCMLCGKPAKLIKYPRVNGAYIRPYCKDCLANMNADYSEMIKFRKD